MECPIFSGHGDWVVDVLKRTGNATRSKNHGRVVAPHPQRNRGLATGSPRTQFWIGRFQIDPIHLHSIRLERLEDLLFFPIIGTYSGRNSSLDLNQASTLGRLNRTVSLFLFGR